MCHHTNCVRCISGAFQSFILNHILISVTLWGAVLLSSWDWIASLLSMWIARLLQYLAGFCHSVGWWPYTSGTGSIGYGTFCWAREFCGPSPIFGCLWLQQKVTTSKQHLLAEPLQMALTVKREHFCRTDGWPVPSALLPLSLSAFETLDLLFFQCSLGFPLAGARA